MFTFKAVFFRRPAQFDGQNNAASSPEQVPSALKVELAAPLKAPDMNAGQNCLQSVSSSAASGGMPPPEMPEENPSR
jgi:hypothetical protein